MDQFNPSMKTMALIEREDRDKQNIKIGKKMARKKGHDYASTEHDYWLLVGDKPSGETKTMFGRDAKRLNSLAAIDFGAGKTERLHIWVWKRAEEYQINSTVDKIMEIINRDD